MCVVLVVNLRWIGTAVLGAQERGPRDLGDLVRCCLNQGYAFVIRSITMVPWRVTCTTAYQLIGYRSTQWTCLTKRICGGRIATAAR